MVTAVPELGVAGRRGDGREAKVEAEVEAKVAKSIEDLGLDRKKISEIYIL